MTSRAFTFLCALPLVFLAGCNRAPENKDAVRQAVIEHLQKNSGLNPDMMQIDVVAVSFAKNEAHATVSFRPKSAPDQGLEMPYVLENKSGKWVVKGRSSMAGGGSSPHAGAGGQMPPAGGAMPGASGASGAALPPGHPAVPMPGQATQGGGQPAAQSPHGAAAPPAGKHP